MARKKKTEEEKSSITFQNGTDPLTELLFGDDEIKFVQEKTKEEIKNTANELAEDLKPLNITQAELEKVRQWKNQFNLNSDDVRLLFSIYLRIHQRYPSPNDPYCGGCVQKALNEVWQVVGRIYTKHYLDDFGQLKK